MITRVLIKAAFRLQGIGIHLPSPQEACVLPSPSAELRALEVKGLAGERGRRKGLRAELKDRVRRISSVQRHVTKPRDENGCGASGTCVNQSPGRSK